MREIVVLKIRPDTFDTIIAAPFPVYQKTQEMKHFVTVKGALQDQGFYRCQQHGEYELWERK